MIVKFLPNKGGGSCQATMNYLLGKERDREHAKILQGDPNLTERLADNLDFKNRYTVGVLSFEETDLSDTKKRAIMASFEQSLLAGLESDQYNICWIEHKDKDRLELNFVIPNVELTTGKRLQPYYDRADRPLVENWKQVINYRYGLSDPQKAQAIKIDPHNLPKDVQAIKERIGVVIADQIDKGYITDRQGVINALERSGMQITRTTDKSISIANPNGKRNIRLEGFIYENRRFSGELGAERTRTRQDYERANTERYQTALSKLQRAITIKSDSHTKNFRRPQSSHQTELSQTYSLQNHHRSDIGGINPVYGRVNYWQSMDLQEVPSKSGRIGTNTTADRTNATASQSPSQIGNWAEPRRHNLDTTQEPQENQNWQGRQQRQAPNHFGIDNYAQRLYEQLQQPVERIRTAIKRAYPNHSQTEQTNHAINGSQSVFDQSERAITGADKQIDDTERQIKQREQQANELVAEQQKSLDRGKNQGFGR